MFAASRAVSAGGGTFGSKIDSSSHEPYAMCPAQAVVAELNPTLVSLYLLVIPPWCADADAFCYVSEPESILTYSIMGYEVSM